MVVECGLNQPGQPDDNMRASAAASAAHQSVGGRRRRWRASDHGCRQAAAELVVGGLGLGGRRRGQREGVRRAAEEEGPLGQGHSVPALLLQSPPQLTPAASSASWSSSASEAEASSALGASAGVGISAGSPLLERLCDEAIAGWQQQGATGVCVEAENGRARAAPTPHAAGDVSSALRPTAGPHRMRSLALCL